MIATMVLAAVLVGAVVGIGGRSLLPDGHYARMEALGLSA